MTNQVSEWWIQGQEESVSRFESYFVLFLKCLRKNSTNTISSKQMKAKEIILFGFLGWNHCFPTCDQSTVESLAAVAQLRSDAFKSEQIYFQKCFLHARRQSVLAYVDVSLVNYVQIFKCQLCQLFMYLNIKLTIWLKLIKFDETLHTDVSLSGSFSPQFKVLKYCHLPENKDLAMVDWCREEHFIISALARRREPQSPLPLLVQPRQDSIFWLASKDWK